jgi:hypothetical protein
VRDAFAEYIQKYPADKGMPVETFLVIPRKGSTSKAPTVRGVSFGQAQAGFHVTVVGWSSASLIRISRMIAFRDHQKQERSLEPEFKICGNT